MMTRSPVDALLEYEKISTWLLQKPPGEVVGIACFDAPEDDFRHTLNVLATYLYERLHICVYVRETGWRRKRKNVAESVEVHPLPPLCSWFVRLLGCMAAGKDHGQGDVSREVAVEVLKTVKEMVDCKSGDRRAG